MTRQEIVLPIIQRLGTATNRQLSEATGIPLRPLNGVLQGMKTKGLIAVESTPGSKGPSTVTFLREPEQPSAKSEPTITPAMLFSRLWVPGELSL